MINTLRITHLEHNNAKVGIRFETLDSDNRFSLYDVEREKIPPHLLKEWDTTLTLTRIMISEGQLWVTEDEKQLNQSAVDITNNPDALKALLHARFLLTPLQPAMRSDGIGGMLQWGSNIAPPHALYFRNGVLGLIEGFESTFKQGSQEVNAMNRSVRVSFFFLSEMDVHRFFGALEAFKMDVVRFKQQALEQASKGEGVPVVLPLRKLLEISKAVEFSLGHDYGSLTMQVGSDVQWIVETGRDGAYHPPVFTNPSIKEAVDGVMPTLMDMTKRRKEVRDRYGALAHAESVWAVQFLQRMRDNGLLTLYRTGMTAGVLRGTGWSRLRAYRL